MLLKAYAQSSALSADINNGVKEVVEEAFQSIYSTGSGRLKRVYIQLCDYPAFLFDVVDNKSLQNLENIYKLIEGEKVKVELILVSAKIIKITKVGE